MTIPGVTGTFISICSCVMLLILLRNEEARKDGLRAIILLLILGLEVVALSIWRGMN